MGVIALVLARTWRPAPDRGSAAREILAQRFARGDVDQGEYRDRLAALHVGPPGRPASRRRRAVPVAVIAAVAAAVALFGVAAAVARPSPGPVLAAPRPGPAAPFRPFPARSSMSPCRTCGA